MRGVSFRWAMMLLLLVASCVSGAQRKDILVEQKPSVYFEGKGQEKPVKRFEKFLDIALDDYNLQKVDSAKGADFTVKAVIKEKEASKDLYAPLIHFVLVSRDQNEQMVDVCNTVSTSESVFKDKVKNLGPITLPADLSKKHKHLSVYLDQATAKVPGDLFAMLKKDLADSGYKIAKLPAEADVELKGLQLENLAVPVRTVIRTIDFEVFGRNSTYKSGSGTENVRYLRAKPGIMDKLPCWSTIEQMEPKDTISWDLATAIARAIRTQLDIKAESQQN